MHSRNSLASDALTAPAYEDPGERCDMTSPKALCPDGHDIKGILRTGMGMRHADEVTIDGGVHVEWGTASEWFGDDEGSLELHGGWVFLCWGGDVFLEGELVAETERKRVAHDAAATVGIDGVAPRMRRLFLDSAKPSSPLVVNRR